MAQDVDALRDDQWDRLRPFVPGGGKGKRGPRSNNRLFLDALRWSPATGQFAKLGSPIQKDEPDGGTTEAVFSGF
jgi:hypothetical protein